MHEHIHIFVYIGSFETFFLVIIHHLGDHPLCSIPIENILAVEKLEEESFKMKNVSTSPS